MTDNMTDNERAKIDSDAFQHAGPPAEGKKASNPKDIIGSGKAPLHLVPASLRAGAALAFMEGALKYGRFNWRLAGVRASIYYDALNRHMEAWFNGEDTDKASGLPHLFKAAACIAILIDAVELDKLVDDRAPYAPMSDIFSRMEPEVARLKNASPAGPQEPHQCVLADSPLPGLSAETPLEARYRSATKPITTQWDMGRALDFEGFLMQQAYGPAGGSPAGLRAGWGIPCGMGLAHVAPGCGERASTPHIEEQIDEE